jgi:hypothetical protein
MCTNRNRKITIPSYKMRSERIMPIFEVGKNCAKTDECVRLVMDFYSKRTQAYTKRTSVIFYNTNNLLIMCTVYVYFTITTHKKKEIIIIIKKDIHVLYI